MVENLSLDRSDLYFAVLHLLRYITPWIEDSATNLVRMRQECDRSQDYRVMTESITKHKKVLKDIDLPAMHRNWNIVLSYQEERKQQLLAKIEHIREDVVMLRDGVSGLAGSDLQVLTDAV
jgi:hypothetical protein